MSENNVASRGDFRGDFSRDTFDQMKRFSRVLMQQGRVQLDADWNEQVSILLHYMRQLGRDLMGPHGAPYPDDALSGGEVVDINANFKVNPAGQSDNKPDFSIASGRYYVSGIFCEIETEQNVTYRTQPDYPITDTEELNNGLTYLVYLDVWERHLTYVEDDSMREKALGDADTATRAQVVWQVKSVINSKKINKQSSYNDFIAALIDAKAKQPGTGRLQVQAKKTDAKKEPCLTTPEASYRGAENQLYRVEIHNSGAAGTATFKWSRENGSVIFPITNIGDDKITLEHLGRDDRFSLQPGDWVEVLDDDVILRNEAHPLLQVKEVDREDLQVILTSNAQTKKLLGMIATDLTANTVNKHPYLRRWDQRNDLTDGVIKLTEGADEKDWIALEDGIEILFPGATSGKAVYQTGDYWLIPARTATGDVEWPFVPDQIDPNKNVPDALLPHGVVHHYAPLAIINVANGTVSVIENGDLRRQLPCGWKPIGV